MQKVSLSGLMFAGKDFVADRAKLKKITVAYPLYELVKSLTGYGRQDGANIPGIREMWQKIGQYGWGCVTPEVPWTIERAITVNMIRNIGHSLAPSYDWVDWQEYGKKKSFWIDIMLKDPETFSLKSFPEANGFAMTSCRFQHELQPLQDNGFEIYLVRCSEETRQERMAAAGYKQSAAAANDISEKLARDLEDAVAPFHTIWNDTEAPAPAGLSCITVEEFIRKMSGDTVVVETPSSVGQAV